MAEGIDYKAVLVDLKARRAALDQAIAGIEAIIGEGPIPGIPQINGRGPAQEILPDTFVGLNIAEAAAKYLTMVGRPARATEAITDALNRGGLDVTQASVGTVLLRNHNQGESNVVRVGRGLWGLADWYPQRPRATRRREIEEDEEQAQIKEMIEDEEARRKA